MRINILKCAHQSVSIELIYSLFLNIIIINNQYILCLITGSEININKALKLIRTKFPEKVYPEFTLDYITPLVDSSHVISRLFKVNLTILHHYYLSRLILKICCCIQSELIEGVNNHVIITHVVTSDHFFVHNASSPDYALLSSLNFAMNHTFGNNKEDIPEVDLRTVTHGIS